MFWGVLTAFLSAINMVVYKKVLVINAKNSISRIGLYGYMCLLVVIMVWIFHMIIPQYIPLDFHAVKSTPLILLGIILFSLLGIFASNLSQYAYKNEKISVLTPFGETGRIITIILGFFLFSGTSTLTFFFALASALILVLASINFRSFSFNRYTLMILWTGVIQSINTFIAGYTLVHISSFSFILADNITISLLVLVHLLIFERSTITDIPKKTTFPLFSNLFLNNLLWFVSYAITLYLMKELGIVTTSLLGMLTIVLTIVSSYIFFQDIPTRKDVATAVIIICCIVGGTIL